MIIKRADLIDLATLTVLFDQYMVFYNKPSNLEEHQAFLRERIVQNEAIIYIAYSDYKPVGFTLVYPSFSSVRLSKILILNDLFVEKKYRNKGVGEELISKVVEFTHQSKADLVRLRTTIDNYAAQGLYRKMNFVQDKNFLTYDLSLI